MSTLPRSAERSPLTEDVRLRDVQPSDLDVFFEHQLDPEAARMAAFTREDPADRASFDAHWVKIEADEDIVVRTILVGDVVAGHILKHGWFGGPEVGYWIGRAFWGRGVATRALRLFLDEQSTRPLHARVARDNAASIRVLEKCGFQVVGRDRVYSFARGEEVVELLLRLDARA